MPPFYVTIVTLVSFVVNTFIKKYVFSITLKKEDFYAQFKMPNVQDILEYTLSDDYTVITFKLYNDTPLGIETDDILELETSIDVMLVNGDLYIFGIFSFTDNSPSKLTAIFDDFTPERFNSCNENAYGSIPQGDVSHVLNNLNISNAAFKLVFLKSNFFNEANDPI